MFFIYLIFFIIIVLQSYVIYNLVKKVEKLEDMILDQQTYIMRVSGIVEQSNELINTVDERGTFKSDDEVGNFFTHLKDIQSILNNYIIVEIDGKKTK